MYQSFFNLTSKPFDLLPNPYFLYLSKSHKRALTYIDYAIRERAGFILVTGEIGSGKTTLIRSLINRHHESIVLARVFNTRVSSEQLMSMINDDFDIAEKNVVEKTALLRNLNEFLIEQYAKGNKPVLIIDEAQNLTPETLEDVRMLSNLETDNAKLLQIILVGQPELRQTLALPSLMQLRQRICFHCHIQPLKQEEVGEYILHRLEIAGNRQAVLFSPLAIDTIWKYSRGIPRLINIICDFLMISAFAEEKKQIDEEMVLDITGDLDFENQYWSSSMPDLSTDGKTISMITGTESATAIAKLLREVTERLDKMGKEAAEYRKTADKVFDEKLAAWGNALLLQVHETNDSIGIINKKIENIIKEMENFTQYEEDKNQNNGFLRKIFK
jgi:putative secretion ATPase (PEP-CTERM system associated)